MVALCSKLQQQNSVYGKRVKSANNNADVYDRCKKLQINGSVYENRATNLSVNTDEVFDRCRKLQQRYPDYGNYVTNLNITAEEVFDRCKRLQQRINDKNDNNVDIINLTQNTARLAQCSGAHSSTIREKSENILTNDVSYESAKLVEVVVNNNDNHIVIESTAVDCKCSDKIRNDYHQRVQAVTHITRKKPITNKRRIQYSNDAACFTAHVMKAPNELIYARLGHLRLFFANRRSSKFRLLIYKLASDCFVANFGSQRCQ